MKTNFRIISFVLLLCVIISCLVACEFPFIKKTESTTTTTLPTNPVLPEWVDYASQLKLDLNSGRARQEVKMKLHIDGDTTHFYLQNGFTIGGTDVLKARYLGIDTPESTGTIEQWGKKASNFTKEKLKNATSIIVESDTAVWDPDSTGERYMVWVWYKTADMTDYRNLNIELLQEGLALSKGTDNAYGEICWNAMLQARAYKLHIYSPDRDPDYYIGSAIPVDLKELATNIDAYLGKKVAFTGVIARDFGQTLFVQSYCEETGMYHGVDVFYGYNFNELSMIKVGNLMTFVGRVEYSEGWGYQVADIKYYPYNPNHPDNIIIHETEQPVVYTLTDPATFVNGRVEVEMRDEDGEEILKTFSYAELALNTAIEMHDLKVTSVYTTQSTTDSNGAMTLTCSAGGYTITVRTEVLKDANGNLITASYFLDKTIDVKGLVEEFNGKYQIKLLSLMDVVVK